MLADELDYVIGVDTHLDEHVLAVVDFAVRRCGRETVGACEHARLRVGVAVCVRDSRMALACGRSKEPAATAPALLAISSGGGEAVLETSRVPRTERRLRGKDDALDAVRTARTALASDTLALPRRGRTAGGAAVAA